MTFWKPDPTFYPSPRDAAAAPPEKLANVAAFARPADKPDAIAVVDVDSSSGGYGTVTGLTELPGAGDELHHFGWNMCSSALCPYAPHPHTERRYLVVPGLRSSRVFILDTKEQPGSPQVVKVLEPAELIKRAGGVALMDHTSFEVLGRWEVDRGDQYLAYDMWWHIAHDVAVTSEWATPSMIEDGVVPDLLLGRKYGHRLHFWDMKSRNLVQTVNVGDQYQMV